MKIDMEDHRLIKAIDRFDKTIRQCTATLASTIMGVGAVLTKDPDIMDSARDAMRGIYKDLELLNGNGNGKEEDE